MSFTVSDRIFEPHEKYWVSSYIHLSYMSYDTRNHETGGYFQDAILTVCKKSR